MNPIRSKIDACRSRFSLIHHPLPRDAAGKNFFDQTAGYKRLEMYFQELIDEPGLGILTAESGVGKTAAIRNLCTKLPEPDFKVIYICDTTISAIGLYRTIAFELGMTPSHRRSQIWLDIKRSIAHLVEEQHTLPVIIVDEAQYLSDGFLFDLCGFLNFAFDRRTLLALWLVGLPSLVRRLQMQIHAPLASRIVAQVHLEPLNREDFSALIDHGFKAAGSHQKLLTDSALEFLWRASRGVLRAASRLLRVALQHAHLKNQNLVDDHTLQSAIDELSLTQEAKH